MKYTTLITSRRNSFFSLVSWILMSISTTILYRYIVAAPNWAPADLALIDTIYSIIRILIFIIIIVHIVSLLFREFEHSFLADGAVIRRFLPLMKVIILGLIWIGGIFSILDGLHINTTSILTGTGIAGVLLAIASRDIITNLFGSLSILLSRTFEIGEIIRVQLRSNVAYEGLVEEITLNYTKMTRLTGEVVFIPNRLIYTETLENISRRRFYDYVYRIPFKKQSNVADIKTRMRIIESKIASYDPIEVLYDTEIPNAVDLVYKVTIMLPEENEKFDYEIRHFLMEHIFIEVSKEPSEGNKI
ncbi:mechanosensitive ion channel [Candidatus Gracilibacteria bacterium]|nr:mechanosensitive ion channel [Candidatus Gracilibacteria bacterium]